MAEVGENGCSKAERLPKSSSSFRATPHTIVTIDFGTTHCSLSYLYGVNKHPNPLEIEPVLLSLDQQGRKRVPSCILFDEQGKGKSFGYQARDEYATMGKRARTSHAYFEHIKKELKREKNISRSQKIKSLNGKAYFLIDVIAHVLCYLKERVIKELRVFGYTEINATDIDWVITVPAIWRAKGRKMMREAGYMAGLCSKCTNLNLKEAVNDKHVTEFKVNPDKLSLALEPESAAIECKRAIHRTQGDQMWRQTVNNYLIVDCGGGTIDIATHGTIGEHIQELASSEGNMSGGVNVNENFRDFLSRYVDDPNFQRYLSVSDESKWSKRVADLNKLVYTTFELQKTSFGDDEKKDGYLIDFPWDFSKEFGEKMEEKAARASTHDIEIEEDGSQMRLSWSQMAKFFAPCVESIGGLIINHLRNRNLVRVIDTIFWVGGFGGCKYLRNQIKSKLEQEFGEGEFFHSCPPDPHLAVIKGALAFRCDPNVIQRRKSDATYGISCRIPFIQGRHRSDYCVEDKEDSSKKWCENIFSTFVEKHESICTNEVFVAKYSPTTTYQRVITITLYSADDCQVWYTTDRGVTELAKMDVTVEGFGRNREIEVIFDITHTEIQVCARDMQSHNEFKMVADFLLSTK